MKTFLVLALIYSVVMRMDMESPSVQFTDQREDMCRALAPDWGEPELPGCRDHERVKVSQAADMWRLAAATCFEYSRFQENAISYVEHLGKVGDGREFAAALLWLRTSWLTSIFETPSFKRHKYYFYREQDYHVIRRMGLEEQIAYREACMTTEGHAPSLPWQPE